MDKASLSQRDRERMDQEAAEWLILQDQGLTPAQLDEFLQWLAEDPRHGEMYARHQQTWRDLDFLSQCRPEHEAEPNPDLLVQPWFYRWRSWISAAAGLAAVIAVAIAWWPALRDFSSDTDDAHTTVTVARMQESRVLEDGTVVQLNSGTMIGVTYLPKERRVDLRKGEAQFVVAENPARPFTVKAGGVHVRAVGTAFNVKLDAEQVEVVVTEGKVRVNPPQETEAGEAPALMVKAGQKTVVELSPQAAAPLVMQALEPEIARLREWQPQLLDFDSTPLNKVVETFNKVNQVQLKIADPDLGVIPIVASFRSDNVTAFVSLLEMTSGIDSERQGDVIVLRKAN